MLGSSDGDLTRQAAESGLFQRLRLPGATLQGEPFLEIPLHHPLALEVGGSGIIGRRVSLYSDGVTDRVVAEGIVGFNVL